MQARLTDGYWAFKGFPECFKFEKYTKGGKILVHTELAPFYKEALEGYAYNKFYTIREAHNYISQFVKIEYTKFVMF